MDEEEQQNSFNNKLKPVSIDKNGEPVYTLTDFLQYRMDELNADIDEVCAVFGECNDVECSYNKGYLKRQALYACHTCIPESKLVVSKAAGVCLACSLHCHNGHDLVELYTKRNFRCDCGNSKFESRCTLIPGKAPLNTANSYNQNFTGLYCTCARPYPDPDDDVEDDMISCALCEDWFHTRHLGVACPPSNSYEEMICEACIKKHNFLLYYDGLSMTTVDNAEPTVDVNIIDVNDCDVNDKLKEEVQALAEQEVSEVEKTEANSSKEDSIHNQNNTVVENEETAKGFKQGLSDKFLPNEGLDEDAMEAGEESDGVYEISKEDVEMNVQDSCSVAQQQRNDICDNLNDISRQCEEIDKAVDDSNKLEALASVPDDLHQEQIETYSDRDKNVANRWESLEQSHCVGINDDKVDGSKETATCAQMYTKQAQEVSLRKVKGELSHTSGEKDTKESPPILEKVELLQHVKEAEHTVVKDKHISDDKDVKDAESTVLKDKHSSDNKIQEGEIKRVCKKPKIKSTQISTKFYDSSRWRENLCICTDCTKLYTDNNVAYLLDPQDTLQFYKEFGREVYVEGAYGAFKRKLDSLPHTGKIFIAERMAEFKDKFGEFLKQFADEQRVITSEDVRTFFDNLDKSRKRRKIEMESNYYCR